MQNGKSHPIEFKGEVIEVIRRNESVNIRVICKHDMIVEADDSGGLYNLGDEIHIEGKLEIENLVRIESDKDPKSQPEPLNEMHIIYSKSKQ